MIRGARRSSTVNMPWKVAKSDQCPADKPWGVFNKTTGRKVACHASEAQAKDQVKALYANVPESRKMSEQHIYLSELLFAEEKDSLVWIHALPAKVWHTEEFGDVPVTQETLQRMVNNFYGRVRGQEIATDYDHGRDRAKGSKASGWIREAEVRDDSLWLAVEPTPTALAELQNQEWKYFSLEWDDWTSPATGERHEDVIIGGGFTNRPIAKGLVPINFSELLVEDLDDTVEFATKTPKKPYGNVTYADPGYQSDNKKRYPLDTETHIRAAWSYINMPKNAGKYSSSQVAKIKARIRAAMKRIGAEVKKMGEDETGNEETSVEGKEEVTVTDESKEMEHSEPGSGSPPQPRTDEDGSDDEAIKEGWRRDTPPIAKDMEGGVENELDSKLREMLGLSEDADIIKAVEDMNAEVTPLREAAKVHSEKKAFAEAYPDEFKRLDKLEKINRDNEAKAFAERFSKIGEDEKKGFSTVVLDKLTELHRSFGEGSASTADLAELMELVGSDKGIVDYEEMGSARAKQVPTNPAKAFSEKVVELQESDKLEYGDAVNLAMQRYPDLFAGYRAAIPGTRGEDE